ncbi:MAG: TusE/DsrC/DsvC family sulfur relay protein [Candidatus Thiodiazotropha sp. LLP2]
MHQTAVDQTTEVAPIAHFDEEGFLLDHHLWNEQVARDLAHEEGLGDLGEQHFQLLHHIRDRYLNLGALPNMRLVCRATGIPRHKVHHLFGSCISIWRIAGLPDPGEEAKSYLS